MKTLFSTVALCVAALIATSCASRPYPVGFHMEVDMGPGNAEFLSQTNNRFVIEHQGRYYDRSPFISTRMFDRYASFINPDGSYGVEFLVEDEWRMRLYAETQSNINKYILPTVNGLSFEIVHISRPIVDGRLVIWGGLNGYDLKMINETVKAAHPEIEEKRFLEKDPRPPRPRQGAAAAPTERRTAPASQAAAAPTRRSPAAEMDIPEG